MTKLLYIQASPRHGASRSIAVADAYLAALRVSDPTLEVDTLELWDAGLPEFDGNRNEAKLTVFGGGTNEGTQATLWDEIVDIAGRFTRADRYLFAIPMWNGGIPYKLKQYIDLRVRSGKGLLRAAQGQEGDPSLYERRLFRGLSVPCIRGRPPVDLHAIVAQSGWRHRP